MRKTDFSFLPAKKRIVYEQTATLYMEQIPRKNTIWSPFQKKLLESKITLISIAGAYLRNQVPFTKKERDDDYDFREIPTGFSRANLKFYPLGWEPSEAKDDLNVVIPIERLILLQKEGLIGKIDETVYSFVGYNKKREILSKNINKIARAVHKSGSDGVFIVPASSIGSETACLIASMIEAKGIATVAISLFREQAVAFCPPRTAFINFPFGRTLGMANKIALQTAILRDTLRIFEKAKSPGEIVNLNYVWPSGIIPDW